MSAVTCYEGFSLQTQVTANSTVNLREGELLVLHCNTTTDIYEYLELTGCTAPPGLPGPAPNTTGFCEITGNYTSVVVHGILPLKNSMYNSVKLLEFDVEIHNLERCLALADTWETPSPCTIPPLIDDPTETADPGINNPAGIQQNDTTNIESEEIKDYTLYTAVCVLGVIALVELMVIVLLAEKLCCRKRRVKMVEDGGIHPEKQQEKRKMSRQSSSSDKDKESVFINRGSIHVEDVSKETAEGEGDATGTDQQQEVEKISQLTPDKDKGVVQVIANGASVHADVETTTNTSKEVTEEGAAIVTEQQDEEEEVEEVGEHNQQNSDTAKETVIANGDTCTMEAKERGRTHGSSTDSVNLTRTTTNI